MYLRWHDKRSYHRLLELEDIEPKVGAFWTTDEEGSEGKRKRGTSGVLVRRIEWNSKSG
jgi:hypothetical protein